MPRIIFTIDHVFDVEGADVCGGDSCDAVRAVCTEHPHPVCALEETKFARLVGRGRCSRRTLTVHSISAIHCCANDELRRFIKVRIVHVHTDKAWPGSAALLGASVFTARFWVLECGSHSAGAIRRCNAVHARWWERWRSRCGWLCWWSGWKRRHGRWRVAERRITSKEQVATSAHSRPVVADIKIDIDVSIARTEEELNCTSCLLIREGAGIARVVG